jgi:hypothetical protein
MSETDKTALNLTRIFLESQLAITEQRLKGLTKRGGGYSMPILAIVEATELEIIEIKRQINGIAKLKLK